MLGYAQALPTFPLPPCGGGTGRGVCTTGNVLWPTSARDFCGKRRLKGNARCGSSYASVRSLDTAFAVRSRSDHSLQTSRARSGASSSRWTVAHMTTPLGASKMPSVTRGLLRRDFACCVWRMARCWRIRRPRSIGFESSSALVLRANAPPPPQPSPIKGEGVKLIRSLAGVRHRNRVR